MVKETGDYTQGQLVMIYNLNNLTDKEKDTTIRMYDYLYNFVSKEPYLNSKKNPLRANTYSKNRIYHYISDGSFWINNDRIEDTDNCNILPETPNEYYNFY
jgi:hypothetical protein